MRIEFLLFRIRRHHEFAFRMKSHNLRYGFELPVGCYLSLRRSFLKRYSGSPRTLRKVSRTSSMISEPNGFISASAPIRPDKARMFDLISSGGREENIKLAPWYTRRTGEVTSSLT